MRQITNSTTPNLAFVLLDKTTKEGKPNIAPADITIKLSKDGGPLTILTTPAITLRDDATYFWKPKPEDTGTDGSFFWHAIAAGCERWRSEELVVTPPPAAELVEAAATLAEIMAGLRQDQTTQIGRIAGQNLQLADVASEDVQAANEHSEAG